MCFLISKASIDYNVRSQLGYGPKGLHGISLQAVVTVIIVIMVLVVAIVAVVIIIIVGVQFWVSPLSVFLSPSLPPFLYVPLPLCRPNTVEAGGQPCVKEEFFVATVVSPNTCSGGKPFRL